MVRTTTVIGAPKRLIGPVVVVIISLAVAIEAAWLSSSAILGAILGSTITMAGCAWLIVRQQRDLARAKLDLDQLTSVIMASPDAICAKDGEGRWILANRAMLDAFGLAAVDWRGRRDSEMVAHGDHYHAALLYCEDTDARTWKAGCLMRGEERLKTPDGSVRIFDTIKIPLYEDDGSRRLLVVMGRDVTDAKRLEQEALVAQQLATIGQMSGGMAHDFNNVLAAISGYAELVRTRHGDDPKTAQWTRRILDAARHASGVIGRLLAFARERPAAPESIDLAAVAAQAVEIIRPILGSGATVVIAPGPAMPVVGDRTLIEQALINLVINARDAMAAGGAIEVSLERRGDRIALSVADRGPGIPPEVKARIFQPFFTTKPNGNGLGLASVQRTAAMHQGEVRCQDRPGGGTVFTMLFPAAGAAGDGRRLRTPRHITALGGLRLLVVEGDEAIAEWVRSVIQAAGHAVDFAATADEAVALCSRHRYDALVTDLNIGPGDPADGIRVAEAAAIPVVYITGFSGDPRLDPWRTRDRVRILGKPFRAEQLTTAIREITAR